MLFSAWTLSDIETKLNKSIHGCPKQCAYKFLSHYIKYCPIKKKFFHLHIQWKMCNKTITVDPPPHLKYVATLPCEINICSYLCRMKYGGRCSWFLNFSASYFAASRRSDTEFWKRTTEDNTIILQISGFLKTEYNTSNSNSSSISNRLV